MDRRDFLKKLGGFSAIVGGLALFGTTTGCYDDYDDYIDYTDYSDCVYADYLDYADVCYVDGVQYCDGTYLDYSDTLVCP